MKEVEEQVKKFYDDVGWKTDDEGKTAETQFFRESSVHSGADASAKGNDMASFFENGSDSVLIAGPGDLPLGHRAVCARFDKVSCVDISWRALDHAKRALGEKGSYYEASLVDLPMADDCFDGAICAHVLYHIAAKDQETAVREIVRVLKPGGRALIIYSNPRSPFMLMQRFLKLLRVNRFLKKDYLYYYSHPLSWWRRFDDVASVEILPFEPISANQARILLPHHRLASGFQRLTGYLRVKHPSVARHLFVYPAIILDKAARG